MIGLEFIAKEFGITLTEVGKELGVTRKSVSNWTKGWQSIPKKHLSKLQEYFGVDMNYFQKELTDLDKIEIQKVKIMKEFAVYDDSEGLFNLLEDEAAKEKTIQSLRNVLENEELELRYVKKFVSLITSDSNEIRDALKMFLLCFNNEFGGNPFESFGKQDLGEDLYKALVKHQVIEDTLD